MEGIVAALFPEHEERPIRQINVHADEIPLFTEKELVTAVRSMKNQKAPGQDGIPSEILKLVVQAAPSVLLRMYNTCLKTGIFPKRWKRQKLVLIDKGKGEQQ